MVPIGPFPCISCPAGCACSADNPSCSCKRLTKCGGQLPWVCLFPSRPLFHSAQTAHIVQPLFSCQAETFRHAHTYTHTYPECNNTKAYSALCVHSISLCTEQQVSERERKKKQPSIPANSCRRTQRANFHTELNYCVQWSTFINLPGIIYSL